MSLELNREIWAGDKNLRVLNRWVVTLARKKVWGGAGIKHLNSATLCSLQLLQKANYSCSPLTFHLLPHHLQCWFYSHYSLEICSQRLQMILMINSDRCLAALNLLDLSVKRSCDSVSLSEFWSPYSLTPSNVVATSWFMYFLDDYCTTWEAVEYMALDSHTLDSRAATYSLVNEFYNLLEPSGPTAIEWE